MGVIVAIGAVIAGAVASAVTAVASIIATIAAAVASTVATIGGLIASSVGAAISSAVSGIGSVMASIAGSVTNAIQIVLPTLSNVYNSIATFTRILVGGMKAFLEAIHFQTMLKVHNLGMIFSKDYREMMQKVYNELAEVSKALKLGPHTLSLILRDARNIVLDVSSLMGRSYDLSQVQWLTTMNDYLKNFAEVAGTYENNPSALIEDLAEWIDKPAIEAKSQFMQTFIGIVDKTVTAVDDTARKVVQLRRDVQTFVLDLPDSISRKIFDKVDPLFQEVDNFIMYEYEPNVRNIRQALDILGDTTRNQTDRLGEITNKILNPGDLMSGVDNLPDFERIRQERMIGDIASRSQVEEMTEANSAIEKAYAGIGRIFEAVTEVRKLPPYHVTEYQGPLTPAFVSPIPRETWFIGDF